MSFSGRRFSVLRSAFGDGENEKRGSFGAKHAPSANGECLWVLC